MGTYRQERSTHLDKGQTRESKKKVCEGFKRIVTLKMGPEAMKDWILWEGK